MNQGAYDTGIWPWNDLWMTYGYGKNPIVLAVSTPGMEAFELEKARKIHNRVLEMNISSLVLALNPM